MGQRIDKRKMLAQFEQGLRAEEKSEATVSKYLHDAAKFMDYVGEGNEVTKETVIAYKQLLAESYAITSANTMLSALNSFLCMSGLRDCMVKCFKVQRPSFRERKLELSKEEYIRLVETAKRRGKRRLCLVMQAICATGIRVSELPFITMEALHTRRARVSLKGKTRIVILPLELCRELKRYARERHIMSGSVFVTRTGKPLDRSNILHQMKALCEEAKVERGKVFPHNLRHLFALTYIR